MTRIKRGTNKKRSHKKILNLAKERANTLDELWGVCRCFYEAPSDFKTSSRNKAISKGTKDVLLDLLEFLEGSQPNKSKEIKKLLEDSFI